MHHNENKQESFSLVDSSEINDHRMKKFLCICGICWQFN